MGDATTHSAEVSILAGLYQTISAQSASFDSITISNVTAYAAFDDLFQFSGQSIVFDDIEVEDIQGYRDATEYLPTDYQS